MQVHYIFQCPRQSASSLIFIGLHIHKTFLHMNDSDSYLTLNCFTYIKTSIIWKSNGNHILSMLNMLRSLNLTKLALKLCKSTILRDKTSSPSSGGSLNCKHLDLDLVIRHYTNVRYNFIGIMSVNPDFFYCYIWISRKNGLFCQNSPSLPVQYRDKLLLQFDFIYMEYYSLLFIWWNISPY